MSLKIDVINLKVKIETDQTRKEMENLQSQFSGIKKEIKSLESQYKKGKVSTEKYNNEMARLQKIAVENRESYEQLRDKIGLTGMSLKELAQYQSELNMLLKQMPGNSPEYKMYAQRLREVNTRMRDMRMESATTQESLGKLTDKFKKYRTVIIGTIAPIMGFILALKKLANDFAAMDDTYADVMKTTDMTRNQVLDLNDAFKKIDTRTSRQQLNQFAEEAGRLGLKIEKDVLGYVRAADQISVSLGDVLGDGATKEVGKLVNIFEKSTNELKGKDLEKQMLSMGSALNELGKDSVANEGYILEFTSRLGGVAVAAGISAQNIMGYGAAIDQVNLPVEMASTAVQKLINTMMKKPKFFAKQAGMDLKDFTDLLNNDVNAAMLQVIESMQKAGNYQDIALMLADAQLSGERASTVLASLATNIDRVKKAQETASIAIKEGTSCTAEFEVKNNTLQAKLDKLGKTLVDEFALPLGEKLYPALELGTKGVTYFAKALKTLIDFTFEYRHILLPLLVAITSYSIALALAYAKTILISKATEAWTLITNAWRVSVILGKIAILAFTNGIGAARTAYALLSKTMKVNPFGLFVTVLATVILAITTYISSINKVNKLHQTMADIQKAVNDNTAEEISKISTLQKIVHSSNLSYKTRIEAINKLKEIIPGYNAQISTEGKIISENTQAIDKYIESMKKQALMKAAQDKITELYKKKIDNNEAITDFSTGNGEKHLGWWDTWISYKGRSDYAKQIISNDKIESLNKENKEIDETISRLVPMTIDSDKKFEYAEYDKALYKKSKEYRQAIDKVLNKRIENLNKINSEKELDYENVLKVENETNTAIYAVNSKYIKPKTNDSSGSYIPDDKSTKDPYSDKKSKLDLDYETKKLELLEKYQTEENMSEESFKRQTLEATKAYYTSLGNLADEYILKSGKNMNTYRKDKIKDLTDTNSTEQELDRLGYDMKKKTFDQNIKLADDSYAKINNDIEEKLSNGEITQEEYRILIATNESVAAEKRKAETQKFFDDINTMTFKSKVEERKIRQEANDIMLAASTNAAKKDLALRKLTNKQIENNEKVRAAFIKKYASSKKYNDTDILLQSLDEQYQLVLKNTQLTNDQRLELEKTYQRAKNIIVADGAAEAARSEREISRDAIKSNYKQRIVDLNKLKAKEEITEEQYNKEVNKAKISMAKEYFDMYMQAASQMISAVKEAEISNIEAEYDAKIAAAEDGSEEQQQLEEEKQAKIKEVKKKYADIEFAMKASEIIANTAVAIMSALELPAPAGQILAAIVGATGVAQLAIANAEREKVKGYKTGGYTDSDSSDNKVAGVTHANEFVATARAVRNPSIRKMLDIVDWAQRTGQEHLINTTDIVRKLMGGILPATASSDHSRKTTGSTHRPSQSQITQSLEKTINKLNNTLENGIYAETNISIAGNNGLAKKQARYNSLRNNARRSWRNSSL